MIFRGLQRVHASEDLPGHHPWQRDHAGRRHLVDHWDHAAAQCAALQRASTYSMNSATLRFAAAPETPRLRHRRACLSTQRSRSRKEQCDRPRPVVPELWPARWHSASGTSSASIILPMLEQAPRLRPAARSTTSNGAAGDVYTTPSPNGSFNIVTCRFAFHHFERPPGFREMARSRCDRRPRGRLRRPRFRGAWQGRSLRRHGAPPRPVHSRVQDAARSASPLPGRRSRRPPGAAVRRFRLSRVRPRRALVSRRRRPRWAAVDDRVHRSSGARKPASSRNNARAKSE